MSAIRRSRTARLPKLLLSLTSRTTTESFRWRGPRKDGRPADTDLTFTSIISLPKVSVSRSNRALPSRHTDQICERNLAALWLGTLSGSSQSRQDNQLHNFRHAEFIKRGKNRVAKSSRLATVH